MRTALKPKDQPARLALPKHGWMWRPIDQLGRALNRKDLSPAQSIVLYQQAATTSRERRINLGLSESEVCGITRIPQRLLEQYEQGLIVLAGDMPARLAYALYPHARAALVMQNWVRLEDERIQAPVARIEHVVPVPVVGHNRLEWRPRQD